MGPNPLKANMSKTQATTTVEVVAAPPALHPHFERFMYFIAIVIPLMTLPQIYTIWSSQNATNVSLSTWLAYFFSALCWLSYSVMTKNRTMLVNQVLWVVLEIILIIGIVLYR